MAGTQHVVPVAVRIGLLQGLLEGLDRQSAGAPYGLTADQVRDVVCKHGYPNTGAMRRAVEVLQKLAGPASEPAPPALSWTSGPAAPAVADAPTPPARRDSPVLALRVSIDAIVPDPRNPRGDNLGDLQGLAASMGEVGLLEPLVVRPHNNGWQLVAGHRRLAAAQLLSWASIDVIVRDIVDRDVVVAMIVENVQREDLNPLAQARSLQAIATTMGDAFSRAALAARLGVSRTWVSDRLDVLTLDEAVQADVASGALSLKRAVRLARGTSTPATTPRTTQPCPTCGRLMSRGTQ